MGTEPSERRVKVSRRRRGVTHAGLRQEGLEASARGAVRDALPLLVRAVIQRPKDSGALIQLGRCLELAGWSDAAEGAYCKAATSGGRRTEAIIRAAGLQMQRGETTEALRSLKGALMDMPGDPWIRRALARAQRQAGKWSDAERNLKAAVTAHGHDWAAHRALVDLHIERGQVSEAARRLHKLRRADPMNCGDLARLGRLQLLAGAPASARRTLSTAMSRNLSSAPETIGSYARAALHSGDHETARTALEGVDPTAPEVALALAEIALFDGDFNAVMAAAKRGLDRPDITAALQARLLYRTGDAANGLQDDATAVEAWSAANRIWEGQFVPNRLRRPAMRVRQVFSRDAMGELPRLLDSGPRIVFVVGAPGSGRGLVARILGSRPQFRHSIPQTGIAKLAAQLYRSTVEAFPDGVPALGRGGLRALRRAYLKPDRAPRGTWVDADPNLRDSLGLACLMFPQAQVVVVDRDTDDLCLSMLRRPDPTAAAAAQRDPKHARALVKTWRRQMSHWEDVLPNRFTHVSYEALVQTPAAVTQRLVSTLGLPPAAPLKLLTTLLPRRGDAPPLDESTVGLGARYRSWLHGTD